MSVVIRKPSEYEATMDEKETILNLLQKFSDEHPDISCKLECAFCDGIGTTINQIKIIDRSENRMIGIFSYRVETGRVVFCSYKGLKKTESENIVDMLLDMINYSKGKWVA